MSNNEKTGIFKGWILGIVNGIDAKMLVEMIKDNEYPKLWEYELPTYLSFAGSLIAEHKDSILEHLNIKTVVEYAREFRPDLARIIAHPAGKKWMTRFLKTIAFMVENSELDAYEMEAKFKRELAKIKEKREKEQASQVAEMLEIQAAETIEKERQIKEMAELKKREEQALEAQRTYEAEKRQTKTIAAIPSIETSMPTIETELAEINPEPEAEMLPTPEDLIHKTGDYKKDDLYDYI